MIYFAQYRTGFIKIGHSKNPEKRMHGLRMYFPGNGPAKLLGTVPGGLVWERVVIEKWRALRAPELRRHRGVGELFRPDPALVDWIERAITQGTHMPTGRKYDPVWLFEPD